ncbi:hypothetical protein AALP_AAs65758U000100 [Arabis alpina]|uniref:Uncharacterized protein n=1 Tax=Arabis alpina TaxID=50452 RepID=A0A087G2H9_ARAAL|nr:hypothetical protein AALP_AAs65758U000100 [Arabis alpina]
MLLLLVGVSLAGPLDRRSSDASSPEVELPEHRSETTPLQKTGPSVSRLVVRDSTEEGSLYVRLETSSGRSEPSDQVETDEDTSVGDKGSLVNFRSAMPKSPGPGLGHGIKLDDSNDVASTMRSSLVYAVEPVKTKTLEDSVITLLGKDKHHIRHWPNFLSHRIERSNFYVPLEDNSPDLPSGSNKKKDTSRKRKVDSDEELELPKMAPAARREGLRPEKAPIAHGRGKRTMTGGGLLADSHRAEAAQLEREKRKEALRRTQKEEERKKKEDAEAKKKKRTEEERKTKFALQKKRSAQEALGSGDRIEKLEARLMAYTTKADQIVLPPIPVDSSDNEEVEPRRKVALDISSADCSDEEVERTEVDGRMSVAGKTPALTRAEIEEAAQDQMDQLELELFGGGAEDNAELDGAEEPAATEDPAAIEEPAATEEPTVTDAVDAATGEPIAPLFSFPDSNPEEQEAAP